MRHCTAKRHINLCLLAIFGVYTAGGAVTESLTRSIQQKDDGRAHLQVQLVTVRAEIIEVTKQLDEANLELKQTVRRLEGRNMYLSPNAPIIRERDRLRSRLSDLRVKEAGLAAQFATPGPSQ